MTLMHTSLSLWTLLFSAVAYCTLVRVLPTFSLLAGLMARRFLLLAVALSASWLSFPAFFPDAFFPCGLSPLRFPSEPSSVDLRFSFDAISSLIRPSPPVDLLVLPEALSPPRFMFFFVCSVGLFSARPARLCLRLTRCAPTSILPSAVAILAAS